MMQRMENRNNNSQGMRKVNYFDEESDEDSYDFYETGFAKNHRLEKSSHQRHDRKRTLHRLQ